MNTYAILQAMTTGHAEHVHTRNRVHTYRGEGIELRYHGRSKTVTLHTEGSAETYATIDAEGTLSFTHYPHSTPAGILAAVRRAGYEPDQYNNSVTVPEATATAADRELPAPDHPMPQTVDVYGTAVKLASIADDDPERINHYPQWRAYQNTRALGILIKRPTGWEAIAYDNHAMPEQATRRDALNRLLAHWPSQRPEPTVPRFIEEPAERHAPAIDPTTSQEGDTPVRFTIEHPLAGVIKVINVPGPNEPAQDYTITAAGAVIAEVSHVDATTQEPEPMQTETARATVNARELARALAVIRPAVAKKTALPVLSTVRLTVHPGTLTVTADNLELRISQHLAAETAGAFDVCADYAFVAAMLKGVKATTRATIEFQPTRPAGPDPKTEPTRPAQLAVTIDGALTYVRDLKPASEFPVLATSNTAEPIAIDAPELLRILARVERSAAKDDSRPVLAGIVLRHDQKRDRLTAAAADGFTLSTADADAPAGAEALHDTIMPARAARAMLAAKLPAECYLTPTTNRSALHLAYEGGAITTRLIEGTFPDYRQIIPREFQTQITLDGPAFYAALQAAGRVARDNNDVCRFDTHTMNGTLDVHATAAERGNVRTPVPTIAHTEPTKEPVAFNWQYLATAYEAMNKPARVQFSLNGPNQAGMLSDPAGNGLTVIMPMVIGAH